VAYGARLESVLGASPRGFESPILRATPVSLPDGNRVRVRRYEECRNRHGTAPAIVAVGEIAWRLRTTGILATCGSDPDAASCEAAS
jgi:hypothetical protein